MLKLKRGQTLIETITAVTIISMSLVAILSLGTISIYYGTQSKEEVIASNLAREGIEIVRTIRDSNWLDPDKGAFENLPDGNWIINYDDTAILLGGTVDPTADSSDITYCNKCVLFFNNFYQHTGGSSTPYKRLVKIEPTVPANPDIKHITSTVSWTIKNRPRSYSLETYLTDWR